MDHDDTNIQWVEITREALTAIRAYSNSPYFCDTSRPSGNLGMVIVPLHADTVAALQRIAAAGSISDAILRLLAYYESKGRVQ